jgi:transposase
MTKNNSTVEAAVTASAKEHKTQKGAKAKRIVIGIDAHLRSYHVARKIDNGAVGPVAYFGDQTKLLLWLEKQRQLAEEVVVVYEAGPLGYVLYRQLTAAQVRCYVCAPDASRQKRTRRKSNSIDTRSLTGNLFNYLNGQHQALQLVRVPSEEQERLRDESREHDELVEQRKQIAARGNSLLMRQGYGSWKNWWRPKTFGHLCQFIPEWVQQRLEVWVDILRKLDEKIQVAKAALIKRYSGARPKGAGAASLVQLEAELLDWNLYPKARKIGCASGLVPSEWSTGDNQRQGPITKVGIPAVRRIIIEMVWRMVLFQPHYHAVKKWQDVLHAKNQGLKKKAVVAIGRQLIVDLWRLHTGRATAQQLGLVMIGA